MYVPQTFGTAKNALGATGTKDAAKGPASDREWGMTPNVTRR